MIISFYDREFQGLKNNASLTVDNASYKLVRRAIDLDDFQCNCEAFREDINPTFVIVKNDRGNYVYGAWLEKFMHVESEEQFVLIILCFSFATMVIYWMLFQPTRKLATALIHAIARRVNAEPVVDAVEEVVSEAEGETNLQASANGGGAAEKPSVGTGSGMADNSSTSVIADSAADKLKAMVDAIKKK